MGGSKYCHEFPSASTTLPPSPFYRLLADPDNLDALRWGPDRLAGTAVPAEGFAFLPRRTAPTRRNRRSPYKPPGYVS